MTVKVHPPKLPPRNPLEQVRHEQLIPEASFEGMHSMHIDAGHLAAQSLHFDEVIFEKTSFAEATLEKLRLMDVMMTGCDFSAARCGDAALIRVHCKGSRMAGVDFSRSMVKDVLFEDCTFDMANFRFAALSRVRFINCMMVESDFQAATLTDVEFQYCHLENTEFSQCALTRVDARSSELRDIRGWQSLKGLVIDSPQLVTIAPNLAAELGLIVK